MRYVVTSRRGRALAFASLCVFVLAISGCGHQPQPSAYDPPGFWSGLLHGFLILFSFIGSLFTDVRIYARVAHTCRCLACVRSVNAQPEPGPSAARNGQSRWLLNRSRG